jgi:sarcosine oxidase subunit alpha
VASGRLPERAGELIDRGRPIAFSYDGRTVGGYAGDTIASALYADGMRTFSRSFKYHRRRGLMCCAGQCPNCLMTVDGEPSVRACVTPLESGMEVAHQNAWPSLDHDLLSLGDRFGGPMMQVGFYYKTFIHPRRAWPLYEKVLRSAAGLGTIDEEHRRTERYDRVHRHVDVLVVGGGPAGLAAAAEAAGAGADVALVDDALAPGGHLAYRGPDAAGRGAALAREARDAGVEILQPAYAAGVYEGLLVPVFVGTTMYRFRPRSLVLAAGALEQPIVFAGNDLPGVMLAGAARRLLNQFRLAPGERAVVVTADDRGVEAALDLHEAGVRVAAVADLRPEAADARLADSGIEHLAGFRPEYARDGTGAVTGMLVTRGAERRGFVCDHVVVSGGAVAQVGMVTQAGGTIAYDRGRRLYLPDRLPRGMHVAGEAAGAAGLDAIIASGRDAGRRAAARESIDLTASTPPTATGESRGDVAAPAPAPAAELTAGDVPPSAVTDRGKQFVCFCEDVTTKDVHQSVEEGFASLELSKRYTTVTMGPCQGRMCHRNSGLAIAEELGIAPDDQQAGVTTARPPYMPTSFAHLAGRGYEPVKRTPVHHWHAERGGRMLWAGDWKRPYDYGDADGEAAAVHESLGLIDVSTLGKMIVRGPDAAAFLERIYPNRFGDMKQARVRYGIVCGDDGAILDDGTVARLSEDAYYVTTTSSGAGAMERWFTWWNAVWGMDADIVNVTSGLAAYNLAGPRAREALQPLTDFDLSNEAFPYLGAGHATIAGVPCLVLRIGFVGELGYEIHCPAAAGGHLWERLMEAGAAHGVQPFGLEPQRVLRLQKMHVIIGQDTNAESNPFEAAMPWIVKLDKEADWIGRYALEWHQRRGNRMALVGWESANGAVPVEGAQIVGADGDPAGRVTSARFSRRLGKAIGIAWVEAERAQEGVSVEISDPSGGTIPVRVTHRPFYDPEGERLRT